MAESKQRVFSLPLLVTFGSWGYNFVALKLIYRDMSAPALALGRWAAMLAGLYVLCWLTKVPTKIARSDLGLVLLQGFISLGLYMAVFLEGTVRTSAGEAAIVLATAPLFTAIFASVFGQERLRASTMLWALCAFAGVSLVAAGGGQHFQGALFGDLLILASAILWAIATVISKPLVGKYEPMAMLTVSMWGAMPVMLIYGWNHLQSTNWQSFTGVTWANLAFIVLVAGVAAFVCFYIGVRQVGASATMLYQYAVPPLANLFAWLVLGQTLAPLQWVGFVVTFVGVVMATRSKAAPIVEAT